MRVNDIPNIDKLTTPEKILLVEELWDSIDLAGAEVPVPQSHTSELDNRMARLSSNPGRLLSLEELCDRIETRK
ncbi:MAG: addiction module protein [Chlorobiaceae bacterium]|jgi:putative addiction module component (TIGR02574 family)|nr:addiction module protein [Chlorobiaceae bacterium]NTV16533.1 addiction module protein [Chlorobiaceae bacterium]